MKIFKLIMITFLILGVITAGCIWYAFNIEPYRIKLSEYTMNKQRNEAQAVKIVQISDLHIKADFTYKDLDKVVEKINEQQPDIIIFTGDLYDDYANYNDDEHILLQLQKMKAKIAKLAVWGNRDYGGGAAKQYTYLMQESGFTLLKNENHIVTFEDGKRLLFTGLDDSMLGNSQMPDTTNVIADYAIMLTHEPDTVDRYLDTDFNLILSGHSHGGQIDIPFLPFINDMALDVTALSSKYSAGMYTMVGEHPQTLYVNTGIGTTHISARFNVIPEIALFHVYI